MQTKFERTDKQTDKQMNEQTDGQFDFIMPQILFLGIKIVRNNDISNTGTATKTHRNQKCIQFDHAQYCMYFRGTYNLIALSQQKWQDHIGK